MSGREGGLRTYQGAVAVVTGAASGIGLALSGELARRGAEVVLADRQQEKGEAAAETLRATGARATAVGLDVTEPDAVDALVRATALRCGRLDYLFNNAGVGVFGEVRLHALADWQHIVDVNLWGVIHGIQAAYPLMARQGFGHIVNTASIAGLLSMPSFASYCATKHAVVGLSGSLRLEAARDGLRVSVLCPGVVRTPILTGGVFGRNLTRASLESLGPFWERMAPIEPDLFARRALDAVARNRGVIIVPWWARLAVRLLTLFPRLGQTLQASDYDRLTREVPEVRRAAPRAGGEV